MNGSFFKQAIATLGLMAMLKGQPAIVKQENKSLIRASDSIGLITHSTDSLVEKIESDITADNSPEYFLKKQEFNQVQYFFEENYEPNDFKPLTKQKAETLIELLQDSVEQVNNRDFYYTNQAGGCLNSVLWATSLAREYNIDLKPVIVNDSHVAAVLSTTKGDLYFNLPSSDSRTRAEMIKKYSPNPKKLALGYHMRILDLDKKEDYNALKALIIYNNSIRELRAYEQIRKQLGLSQTEIKILYGNQGLIHDSNYPESYKPRIEKAINTLKQSIRLLERAARTDPKNPDILEGLKEQYNSEEIDDSFRAEQVNKRIQKLMK